ncbi:MAG TPA: DNA polymerase Y family protein [Burkholderiaceae bacterium]|nr:DNA polymerase Y family protein [Burkholderiaceae bacterium]
MALWEEAVLFEVEASLRLFGGARTLRERVMREAAEMGCLAGAGAPTAWGALALARCLSRGTSLPAAGWPSRLDAVPLECLPGLAEHQPVLARLGCRTLGEVRRLPRPGLARRFGDGLLGALDRAYGQAPERFEWLALPEVFDARLELPGRVQEAAALLFGARRLVLQLCGWLAARHAGVREVLLQWRHDFHRPGVDDAGELRIRTAELTREPDHLLRLMGEWLARTTLPGPVGELRLRADTIEPWTPDNRALALDAGRAARDGESLTQLLERLSARMGGDRVLRPVLRSDHRLEGCEAWVPAGAWQAPSRPLPDEALPALPRPTWLLPQPLPLVSRQDRPHHQGPLVLLAGPHRVETGWWDAGPGPVARDYFVAYGERVGLVWIYRERRSAAEARGALAEDTAEAGGWFLQGVFG